MGSVIFRGTEQKPRFYLKYLEVDGTERTRAAKGARTKDQAREMLATIERQIMHAKISAQDPARAAEPAPLSTTGDIRTRIEKRTGKTVYDARYVELDGRRGYHPTKARSYEEAVAWLCLAKARVARGEPGDVRPRRDRPRTAAALTLDSQLLLERSRQEQETIESYKRWEIEVCPTCGRRPNFDFLGEAEPAAIGLFEPRSSSLCSNPAHGPHCCEAAA